MNNNLEELLNSITEAVNEMNSQFKGKVIYSSARGGIRGKEAVYSKKLSEEITLRLVDDGTYTIGGENITEEAKREFLGKLQQLMNSRELTLDQKQYIYPILNATQEAIDNPSRDKKIKDVPLEKTPESTPEKTPEKTSEETMEPVLLLPAILAAFQRANKEYTKINSGENVDIIGMNVVLRSNINNIERFLKETKEVKSLSSEQQKELLDILKESKRLYESMQKMTPSIASLDSNLNTDLEEIMKKVDEQIKQLEPEKPETKGVPNGKVSIVFNALEGTYTMQDGTLKLKEMYPDKFMTDKHEDAVIADILKRHPGKYDEAELHDYIDINVYALLANYDERMGTRYADEFVQAVMSEDPSKMPIDLKYLLCKKNNISKENYKNITILAKNYKKDKIATVENIKPEKEKKQKEEATTEDKEKKGLLASLKALGASLVTAVVNLGLNVKDVITGKKKFKELFSRDAFKRIEAKKVPVIPEKSKSNDNPKKDEEKKAEQDKILEDLTKRVKRVILITSGDVRAVDEHGAEYVKTLRKMAEKRGVDIEDETGKNKKVHAIIKEIATKEYEKAKSDSGYLLPEEQELIAKGRDLSGEQRKSQENQEQTSKEEQK